MQFRFSWVVGAVIRILMPLLLTSAMVATACVPVHPTSASRSPTAARVPLPGTLAQAIAFVNVNVIPMDQERVIPAQTVLVQGGWITALGPVDQVPVPAGALRIDGQGKYLMPGLADMHIHLGHDSASAERQLFLYVANGVTTVRHMPSDFLAGDSSKSAFWLRLRSRAAAGELWSPRIYTSGFVGCNKATPATIGKLVADYKAAGYDFIKMRELGCGAQGLPLFDSVAAAARRVGMPIAGHVVEGITLQHAFAAGYASIEHLTGYFHYLLDIPVDTSKRMPGQRMKAQQPKGPPEPFEVILGKQRERLALAAKRIPEIVAETKRAGVWNTPTLTYYTDVGLLSNRTLEAQPELRYYAMKPLNLFGGRAYDNTGRLLVLGMTSEAGLSIIEGGGYVETMRQLVKALQDAGAGLLLGTDGEFVYLVPGFDTHRELEALVLAGLTPYQALVTGTRNPAMFFGKLDESGTVAVGKRADLVLLSANPLQDVRNADHPSGVMVGGRWLTREVIDERLEKIAAEIAVQH